MDAFTTESTVNLGVELTKLALKGTVTAVTKKITIIKNEKDIKNINNAYSEIVNELIQERDEAVRIAQSYKSELDRVVISDDDIEHLHNTISRLLEVIKNFPQNPDNTGNESSRFDAFEPLKELINMDTLKTMQLLGFNYKAAIGDPLTNLCANAIRSFANKKVQSTNNASSSKKK